LSRIVSVTHNVTLNEPTVTHKFKFTIKRNNQDDQPNPVREALYWYDVPLAAVPVKQKGWPDVPIFPAVGKEPETFMNGRQYFLWWKNDFKVNEDPEKGELGMPVIHNPFPTYDNVRYEMGGETSKRWGS
jgi:hypothetical protein